MKTIRNKILRYILALVISFSAILPGASIYAENQTKTIKIGYIDYSGFIGKADDGTYFGYGVDLLNRIAESTNWEYEYVYDTFANQLENLKNGTIDFICHAQHTEERDQTYLFSKNSSGGETAVLYSRSNDDRYYFEDFSAFNGMKVGMLAGSFQNDEFKSYAEINNFTYEEVDFSSQEEAFKSLDAGTIDAVAMGSLGGVDGYKVTGRFGYDPFYFMSGKQNQSLVNELDTAMSEIYSSDPTYILDLQNTYYGNTSAGKDMLLTRQEAEYINQADEIRVGLVPSRSPLIYEDENGKAKGMLVDIMDLISAKTGLKFTYSFLAAGQTGMDYLSSGQGDIVLGVAVSAFSNPNPALLKSKTLLTSNIVLTARAGTAFDPTANLTVALPTSFIGGQGAISKVYPNFDFLTVDSSMECLDAVNDGKADITVQNIYVIREMLQSPKYESLQFFEGYQFEEDSVVVGLENSAELITIIDKARSIISEDESAKIITENTLGKVYHQSFSEVVYKFRVPLMLIGLLLIAVIGLLAILNINRQKSYKMISDSNLKLEHKNEQLAEAVQQADNANTAKSTFLARMSHEIRTPMNAIVGLTELTRIHIDDKEKVEENLTKIDTSSKILLNIINDVLDMSAIENNKMKIDNSDFDLKKVIDGLTTVYYPQCKDKGIDLKVTADIENELLVGDSLRVNQVMLNLISNAYKFTERGGSINIRAKETMSKEGIAFIRFTVTDTGCGMDEEMLGRLFKPFEQESAKTAQKHGGSGLGLSIAKNLVDLMGGQISATSTKGVGTTFTVDLPFKISDKKCTDEDMSVIQQMKVLLIDDESDALEYAGDIFKRLNIRYDTAENGKTALELLKTAQDNHQPYNAVFTDWKMAGMDGIEVTREIRRLYSKDMVVIIVSSYDLSEVRDTAREAGADYFITKPLFQSNIFNVLMQMSGGTLVHKDADPEEYDFTGHRVLLAEDNELNTEIATELLELVNMQVEHAENGKIASEMFEKAPVGYYDVILMDIQMPVMDGYEATRSIRGLEREDAKRIPIYAMTANAFTSDVTQAISAGMNGHIAKPIDTEILYKTLYKAIH